MDTAASAEGRVPHAAALLDSVTPEDKLICLSSWLQRTTMKETQAAQACSILAPGLLMLGTAFAGVLLGMGMRWSALFLFLGVTAGALGVFLFHHRRWTIWKTVAERLQTEQRAMIGPSRAKVLSKAACHSPEKLAALFHKQEPVRLFAGPALVLYAAVIALGVLLLSLAQATEPGRAPSQSATLADAAPLSPSPPASSNRPPLF